MEDNKLTNILRVPIFLLKIAGIWQLNGSSKLYKAYGIVFHVLGIDIYALFQLIFIMTADSLVDLSDALSVFFTYFMLCGKAVIYAMKADEMIALLADFKETIQLMDSVESKEMASLEQRLKQVKVFFRALWGACLSSTITGGLVPVTTYLINPNPPYQNPYKVWFPTDFKNEFGWFVFVASYQSLNAIFYCGVVSAMDTFPVLCFNVSAGLLEELGERLSSLSSTTEENKDEKSNDEHERVKHELNLRLIEKYIALHLKIKVLIRRAETIFSPMIFAQGTVSLIILCTSAYSLSKMSPTEDFSQCAFVFLYMCPMIMQILLPCYFGNEISIASANLSTRLFHSEWFQQDRRFVVAMKMFMENTKNRIVVVAADGFFKVNLTQFLGILNLSYSLYALLQRMN